MISSVERVNKNQKEVLFSKLTSQFGSDLSGKSIAVWGLSFKPDIDDLRESPAMWITKELAKTHEGKVIAVEPNDSAIISGGEPGPHPIQGIGPGFFPEVFNTKSIDGAIRITKEEAFAEVQNLAKMEGILVGISTGASVAAVRKQLQTVNPEKTILTINYDTGERYLSIEGLLT